jgi:hypothetical protein
MIQLLQELFKVDLNYINSGGVNFWVGVSLVARGQIMLARNCAAYFM